MRNPTGLRGRESRAKHGNRPAASLPYDPAGWGFRPNRRRDWWVRPPSDTEALASSLARPPIKEARGPGDGPTWLRVASLLLLRTARVVPATGPPGCRACKARPWGVLYRKTRDPALTGPHRLSPAAEQRASSRPTFDPGTACDTAQESHPTPGDHAPDTGGPVWAVTSKLAAVCVRPAGPFRGLPFGNSVRASRLAT